MDIKFQCDLCGEQFAPDPRTMVEASDSPDEQETCGMCICIVCQDNALEEQEGEDWKNQ